MKTLPILALSVAVLTGYASSAQSQIAAPEPTAQAESRVSKLSRLKKEKKYYELLFALFPTVRKGANIKPQTAEELLQDVVWLRTETASPNDADFPLYYFFSWMLASGSTDASRLQNARGRIRLMLDANLCKTPLQFSAPWNALVEGGVFDHTKLREGREWFQAVDAALDWHEKAVSSSGSKDWYCGPQNSIPPSEMAERQMETLKKIRQANSEKLKQYGP